MYSFINDIMMAREELISTVFRTRTATLPRRDAVLPAATTFV